MAQRLSIAKVLPSVVKGSEAIYNAVVFSQLWGTQDLVDIQKAYFDELVQKLYYQLDM